MDVGFRALTWNVARTVLASASTAILVSGFPMLLGLTAKSEPGGLVGQLIFTITLTRAPLIVTVMALQSYFVVRFRDGERSMSRTFLSVLLLISIGTFLLAGLGCLFGGPLLEWVSGSRHISIEGNVIAVLVASSGLVAALSVTGSAVLARARHLVYSSGWFVAAIVTIGVMMTGIDFIPRVEAALILGPAAGLLVHLAVFAARPRRITS